MFACLDSAGRCSEAMPGLQRSTLGRDAEGTGMTIVAIVFTGAAIVFAGAAIVIMAFLSFGYKSDVADTLSDVGAAIALALLAVAFAVLAVAG